MCNDYNQYDEYKMCMSAIDSV